MADQLADLPPILASSGQKWQFSIYTLRIHIGKSTGRSTPQYWHLVVKNGNFTFLLLEFILADQLADLPPKSAMHHGMYIMGCIWQPFWILQEKVGICFYF